MGVFNSLMERYKDKNDGQNPGVFIKIAYAFFGGSIGAFISNPADQAMVNFMNDGTLKKKLQKNYKNLFDCFIR